MKEQGGWRKRQKDRHLPEIPDILFLKYEHCPWYSEQKCCQDFHDVWNLQGAHHLQTPASTKEYDNRFKEMWIIKTKTSKKENNSSISEKNYVLRTVNLSSMQTNEASKYCNGRKGNFSTYFLSSFPQLPRKELLMTDFSRGRGLKWK